MVARNATTRQKFRHERASASVADIGACASKDRRRGKDGDELTVTETKGEEWRNQLTPVVAPAIIWIGPAFPPDGSRNGVPVSIALGFGIGLHLRFEQELPSGRAPDTALAFRGVRCYAESDSRTSRQSFLLRLGIIYGSAPIPRCCTALLPRNGSEGGLET